MTDEELIQFNQRGFIPGPNESESHFLARVRAAEAFFASPTEEFLQMERVPHPHWDWVRHHLQELYDFRPDSLIAYYSNRKLPPWQGAASWILDTFPGPTCAVQLRRAFQKGSYLGMYSRDEILAHEAVHAARCAFEEPASEEFLAYFTSHAKWRRVFGPIVKRPWEAALFLGVLALGSLFGNFIPATVLLSFAFIRLITQHNRMRRAAKMLMEEVKEIKKVRAILLRLTDEEIKRLSNGKSLVDDQSLRFRAINLYRRI